MTSIQLDDVGKVYPDGFEAVRHVDLRVDDGELRVLLGPSGCGKSTLLRLIAGLEDATSGDIRLDGRRVNDEGPRQRDVAMAFQQHALYPQMTVAENIGFPLKMSGAHPSVIHDRVAEIAQLLHLCDVLDCKPSRISGGQQQRVSLGRSMIRSPKLFLMDEPLASLDSRLRIESRTQIHRLQRRLGTTTVFVTHDQSEAMSIADRITVMRDGVVVQSGTPTELYDRPCDIFVGQFVGSPQMNVLLGTVVDEGHGIAVQIGSHLVRLDTRARCGTRPTNWTAADGQKVAVGIRPEAFRHCAGGGLVTSVESTESTGSDQLVHAIVDAPAIEMTSTGVEIGTDRHSTITAVTTPHDDVGLWAPFELRVDRDAVHFFDLATGRNLAA